MSKYVLTYFPVKSFGECVKLLLVYGGEKFEYRFISKEDWPPIQSQTPFGLLPILEFEGKTHAETIAICRYLGRKYGLAGDTNEDQLEIDQVMDFFLSIRIKGTYVRNDPDREWAEKAHVCYWEKYYPFALGRLNEIITRNNGHVALGKLTWGDFVISGLFDHFKVLLRKPDLEVQYPGFKMLVDNVYSLPRIKEYNDANISHDCVLK